MSTFAWYLIPRWLGNERYDIVAFTRFDKYGRHTKLPRFSEEIRFRMWSLNQKAPARKVSETSGPAKNPMLSNNKKKEEEDALKNAEERREAARQKEAAVKKELEDLDGPYRRLEEAKKKNEELEKEKEDLDADNERLELEIAQIEAKLKQPDGCGCVIQ